MVHEFGNTIKDAHSGAVAGVGVLVLLNTFFGSGFKDSLKWLGIILGISYGYKKFTDYQGNTGNETQSRSVASVMTPARQLDQVKRLYGTDGAEAEKYLNTIRPFRPALITDMNQYYADGKGNLADNLKQELNNNQETKTTVKTAVDTVNTRKHEIYTNIPEFNDPEIRNVHDRGLTLGRGLDLIGMTPEEKKQTLLNDLQIAIAQTTNPADRQVLQGLYEQVSQTDVSTQ